MRSKGTSMRICPNAACPDRVRLGDGQDEAATVRDLKGHQAVILPLVGRHGGRIIDAAGDGILAEFPSVIGATECAVDIQTVRAARNEDVPEHRRMLFRIGINLGDVIHDETRIYGDGINVAARLEGLAEPAGVLVSRAVYDQVRDRLQRAFEDLGERELKNIARPVRVYRVRTPAESKAAPAPGDALPLPDKPSIAVLPFPNMSGDPEQGYCADGIAEDIITGLSRLRWLFVIARNSSFTYKGRNVDVRQVGRELGVRYVLEGSVRKGGNRIRITGQLIEAETGNHLWAQRYDRALDDVFAIQDEITESVIGCIQPELYAAEHDRVKRKPPRNLDAWESFVRGMFLYSQHSDPDTKEALNMLDRAIELDRNYAQAHGLRAVCLAWRAVQGWEDRDTAFAEVAEVANRAVTYDPHEPWAYPAHGFIAVGKRRNSDAAEQPPGRPPGSGFWATCLRSSTTHSGKGRASWVTSKVGTSRSSIGLPSGKTGQRRRPRMSTGETLPSKPHWPSREEVGLAHSA
jgi:adenylate cyclase